MKNLKKISIALMILLIATTALAVPAEKGNIVILGREGEVEGELMEEKVDLYAQPGLDTPLGRVKSGVEAEVLDTAEHETGNFYMVLVRGRYGGQMGWVHEDYIYEVTKETPEPQEPPEQ